jgi:2-polyprenyl-6-methoxyphenol hydroxylase-like FAD-dependent oxidoreductase
MQSKTALISGLGIAGPTLAYWLNAAGYETTIVERAPALRRGGYVVDFWGLGYDIAERMNLGDDLERTGYHMREVRIVGSRGKRRARFGTDVFRDLAGGRFITIARSDLSRLLYEKIAGRTKVLFGDDVAALDERADAVNVRFTSGAERRFALVFGTDGLHSNIRRLVFGPQDRFEKQLGYAVAAFEVPGYRPRDGDIYVLYSQPGRMVGRFALHEDCTLFLFVFHTGTTTLPISLAEQKAMLAERYRDDDWECPQILAALEHAEDLYFDRISQIRMDRWSQGRVALLGDAAFCVSLLAGQGTALATTAAYVLASELALADGRHDEAFARYRERLNAFIDGKQRGAERFASALAPRTRWGIAFRNLVVNLLAIPGFAKLTAAKDIVDRLALPAYKWPHPPSG